MVKVFDNILVDQIAKQLQIEDVARVWIRVANKRYDKRIVVAVIVRVITFAKDLLVLFIAPGGIMQPVGSIKMFLSREGNFH